MLALNSVSILVLVFSVVWTAVADRNGFTTRDMMEEMDRLMVETGFMSVINPCSTPPVASITNFTGEQNTAQWVRLAFHDAITADVTAGTG